MADGVDKPLVLANAKPSALVVKRSGRYRRNGAVAALAVAMLLASLLWRPAPLFVWNASSSSPIGLYLIGSPKDLRVGDTAIAWPPNPARRIAADRHYLPRNVPLVKRVAGVAGSRVCANGSVIIMNGKVAALRRSADPSGRPMPWWSGCEVLGAGDLFLLSSDKPEAFDGRYFGVTRRSEVIGSARRLWAL